MGRRYLHRIFLENTFYVIDITLNIIKFIELFLTLVNSVKIYHVIINVYNFNNTCKTFLKLWYVIISI